MSDRANNVRAFFLTLGDTNQKRWKKLSADSAMTRTKFMRRLEELKYSRDPTAQSLVWDLIAPEGPEMTFRDFVCFLQDDEESGHVSRPRLGSAQPGDVIDALAEQRMTLLGAFLQKDEDMLGFVSQKKFTEEAIECGAAQSAQSLYPIIKQLDPDNTGRINYFQLLYLLTTHLDSPEPMQYARDDPAADNEWKPGSGPRKNLDPTIFGSSPSSGHLETDRNPNARTHLDPDIFGRKPEEQTHQAPRGGRGQLDTSIFGEKPTLAAVSAAPQELIDFEKTKDCTDYNMDQTISYIARFANQKYRSIRDCFQSWRGPSDRLSGDDIYRAIAKEAGVELPRPVIMDIAKNFGTDLTVAAFTRLITEGARINAPEPVRAEPPPPTHEETILINIANQLKGKPWEPQIKYSKNALDLSRNLKKLGVNIKSEELRGMYEEMGMKEIIEQIKVLQKPKKKRG